MYALVREPAADGIPVGGDLPGAWLHAQAFYKWRARPVSDRDWADAHLVDAAREIHADDPVFATAQVELALLGSVLGDVGEPQLVRLIRRERAVDEIAVDRFSRPWLWALPPSQDREDAVGAVQRCTRFSLAAIPCSALGPSAMKVRDKGRLLRAPRRVLDRSRDEGAARGGALRNAIGLRSPVAIVVHSARGSQFRSRKFVRLLHEGGLVGSMGRTGTCADNVAMESFFALLQKNVLDRQRWSGREDLRLAIVIWIVRTYHRRRRQRAGRDRHTRRAGSRPPLSPLGVHRLDVVIAGA